MWEFFRTEEFTCKCGCGRNRIDPEFVSLLDELRRRCGFPLVVTSGFRCEEHPEEAKKKKPGRHFEGIAADLEVRNGYQRFILLREALDMDKFRGIGTSRKFIHLDTRDTSSLWVY